MDGAGLEVHLGGAAPHHHGALQAVLRLERLHIAHQRLGQVHLGGRALDVAGV
jgi:hypothetical protein